MRIYNSKIMLILFIGAGLVLLAGCGTSKARKPASVPVAEKTAVAAKTSAEKDSAKAQPVKPEDARPNFVVQGDKTEFVWGDDKGKPRMQATALAVTGDDINRIAVLSDFSGKMFEDGKLSTTMSAPKVIADSPARIVTASDGVVLKSLLRDTVVKARWIRWYANKQKVIGIGDVKITSGKDYMTGSAFVADTDLRSLTVGPLDQLIKGPAKGLSIK